MRTAATVCWDDPDRAQNRVEIDHAIKRAARPDPFVNRLPNCFLGFRVVARNDYIFKRSDRGTNHLDAASVCAGNRLAVRVDQVFRSANISWIGKVALAQLCTGETDVIDTFEQHNVSSPGIVRASRSNRAKPLTPKSALTPEPSLSSRLPTMPSLTTATLEPSDVVPIRRMRSLGQLWSASTVD